MKWFLTLLVFGTQLVAASILVVAIMLIRLTHKEGEI